jgi:hypothetical protein
MVTIGISSLCGINTEEFIVIHMTSIFAIKIYERQHNVVIYVFSHIRECIQKFPD